MKVRFKNNILSYSGKVDNLVFYWNTRLGRNVFREYVRPGPTAKHARFGAIALNLRDLNLSAGYIADLKVYVDLWNTRSRNVDKPYANWLNVFYKIMYACAKKYDGSQGGEDPVTVDLSTLTRLQITEWDLPCISVNRAVEAGLLAPVSGHELLTQGMWDVHELHELTRIKGKKGKGKKGKWQKGGNI